MGKLESSFLDVLLVSFEELIHVASNYYFVWAKLSSLSSRAGQIISDEIL